MTSKIKLLEIDNKISECSFVIDSLMPLTSMTKKQLNYLYPNLIEINPLIKGFYEDQYSFSMENIFKTMVDKISEMIKWIIEKIKNVVKWLFVRKKLKSDKVKEELEKIEKAFEGVTVGDILKDIVDDIDKTVNRIELFKKPTLQVDKDNKVNGVIDPKLLLHIFTEIEKIVEIIKNTDMKSFISHFEEVAEEIFSQSSNENKMDKIKNFFIDSQKHLFNQTASSTKVLVSLLNGEIGSFELSVEQEKMSSLGGVIIDVHSYFFDACTNEEIIHVLMNKSKEIPINEFLNDAKTLSPQILKLYESMNEILINSLKTIEEGFVKVDALHKKHLKDDSEKDSVSHHAAFVEFFKFLYFICNTTTKATNRVGVLMDKLIDYSNHDLKKITHFLNTSTKK